MTSLDVPGNDAGPYTTVLDKITNHTTEGVSIPGAIAAYRQHNSWPHMTVDYRKGRRDVSRHLSLSVAARALRNTKEPGQTNRAGTVQIEIVGSAQRILDQYDAEDWTDFGRDIIGPIIDEYPTIPAVAPLEFHPYPPDGGHRLGTEPWRVVTETSGHKGIIGHQHWRENVHGDPGALSAPVYDGRSAIDLIIDGATSVTPTPPKDGWLMALTDREQRELYEWVREIYTRVQRIDKNTRDVPGRLINMERNNAKREQTTWQRITALVKK